MIQIKPDTESAKEAYSAMFSEVPDIKCKGSMTISRVCCSPDCQHPSLHCQSSQCQFCIKRHDLCLITELKKWNTFLKEKSSLTNKYFEQFAQLEKNMLAKMSEIKNSLNEAVHFAWMETKYVDMLKQIYLKKNGLSLTSKLAYEFSEILRKQSKRQNIDDSLKSIILQEFIKQSNKIVQQFQKLKSDTITTLVKNQVKLTLNSKIAQKKQDVYLLNLWLRNPVKADLIFRASDNGFSAAKFHQTCDNIPQTLVIAKTEFGKIIGGYTPITWNSASSNYSKDSSGQSFVYSLTLKQKFCVQKSQQAIYCNNSYGPSFGNGHDIYLSNQCHNNNSSYTNFPYAYNENTQYKNGQQSYTAFCGALSGRNFKVMEYEVFKISWK